MNTIAQDPFARVAVFPLTQTPFSGSSGRLSNTLQSGIDVIRRTEDDSGIQGEPGPEGPPGDALEGYHEETVTFYDEDCEPVEKTILVKD